MRLLSMRLSDEQIRDRGRKWADAQDSLTMLELLPASAALPSARGSCARLLGRGPVAWQGVGPNQELQQMARASLLCAVRRFGRPRRC
jgi:hypothetical protein